MVLGVAGVLVTTLFMGFAASWVFLYPLSFHAAGQWTDTTAAIFHGSVLLVGLSIVTWCLPSSTPSSAPVCTRSARACRRGSGSRSASASSGRGASRPTRATSRTRDPARGDRRST